jgi:hypothetical protein
MAHTAGYHVTSGDGGFASAANSLVIGNYHTGGGDIILATTNSGPYASGRVIIKENGNVGIGTSSPSSIMELNVASGNLEVKLAGATATHGIRNQADGSWGDFDYTNSRWMTLRDYSGDYYTIFTGGAERLRINSTGNVGIGTSSLDNKVNIQESALSGRSASNGNTSMTIEHATDTGIQFFSATQTQLRFGDAASTGAGSIIYEHATDKLRLNTGSLITFEDGGVERMRISAGNVGIGMTPTNFGNGYTVLQVANASNGGMLYLTNTANAGGRIYGNGAGLTYDAFSTTYHAFITNSAERLRIDSSGNVGIGTSSPSSYGKLAVYNVTGDIEVACVTGSANYATYRLQNSSRRYSMQIRTDQANAWVLRDESAASNRFIMGTNGYFGFAVGAPTQMIHLNGGTAGPSNSGIAAAWNVHSDYRLKENVATITMLQKQYRS